MRKIRITVLLRLRALIERFRILTGPGVRIDTGVAEGDSVPAEFDSMIAKIIAYGQNRKEALSRLQRALRESVVVIKDGASNKAFLLELLSRSEVQRGDVHNGWLDRLAASGEHLSRRYADVALVQAAIEAYDAAIGGGADTVLCLGGARTAAGPNAR